MKTRSFLSCTALVVVLATTSFAANHPAADVKTVLNQYAESYLNTDAGKLEKILSDDVLMKFSRGTEVLSQSQSTIVKTMRQNQGIKQNCSTVVDVLASSNAMVVAKVNFIYEGFVVENYLTLELDKSQNWKITRIHKFFTEASLTKVLTQE